jgi:hypothetical protein
MDRNHPGNAFPKRPRTRSARHPSTDDARVGHYGGPCNPRPRPVQRAPAQSPATSAGLCRIATSLWLHFVASPQRVPVGYRRRGHQVMNIIYRVPPSLEPASPSHIALGTRQIESAAVARTLLRWRGWCRSCQVSFLELMSQLVRERNFGAGGEVDRRLAAAIAVVQLNLWHVGLPLPEGTGPLGRRTLTRISRARNEMSCQNRPQSLGFKNEMAALTRHM